MASREELFQSIQPGMELTKAFFLRVYGYEITWPGFAGQAISELERVGCLKAWQYYEAIVKECEDKQCKELQEVSRWYAGEREKNCQRKVKDCKKKEGEEKRKLEVQNLTRTELTELCKKLLQDGIITDPAQFVTAVLPDQ